MKELGSYLLEQRTSLGMSLKDLAKQVSSSDSTLSKLERGEIEIVSPFLLRSLAEIYHLDIFDLYVRAGYLTEEEAQNRLQRFISIEGLEQNEIDCIQNLIHCLNRKGKGKNNGKNRL